MIKVYKRSFDLVMIILIVPIAIPLCLLFGGLFAISNWERPIFRQRRIGYQNKPFLIWKLKTMTEACDSEGKLLPDSDRLTSLGRLMRKFSIDEFPQILNVALGEMSIVGPRPQSEEFFIVMTEEERRRHEVLPGITGWAQINGRNGITWEERFKLDAWYVNNNSFYLDIMIIFKTPFLVLAGNNTSFSGHDTMPKLIDLRK